MEELKGNKIADQIFKQKPVPETKQSHAKETCISPEQIPGMLNDLRVV